MSFGKRLISAFTILIAICAVIPLVHGQTVGGGICVPGSTIYGSDDGFNPTFVGGATCCTVPTQINLPQDIPQITMAGSYACFLNCAVEATFPVTVTVDHFANNPARCDVANVSIAVASAGPGSPSFNVVSVLAKFSRTFRALTPTDSTRQVWRYLLHGRITTMAKDGPVARPCPEPPCLAEEEDLEVVGHIDFSCALEPDGGGALIETWRFAVSLTHHAGCLSHANYPAFNGRNMTPGNPNRHDDRSYHLVAPVPFNFIAAPPAPATIDFTNTILDAVRSSGTWNSPVCNFEEQTLANLVGTAQGCTCSGLVGANPIYFNQNFPAGASFVGCNVGGVPTNVRSFSSIPTPEMPGGFLQLYLGRWPAGTLHVGDAELFTNLGFLDYLDQCPLASSQTAHVVFGVTTRTPGTNPNEPVQVRIPGNGLFPVFTDFFDSVDTLSNAPFFGTSPFGSNVVWMYCQ